MVRRSFRNAVPAIAGCAFVYSLAAAQSPTTVAVRVELAASRYQRHFGARRPEVETAAARLFAEFLSERVGFLRFATADTTPPYHLVFALDRHERGSAASFAEVGFWARLERPADAPIELYWIPFRAADQSTAGVGSEQEFLGEISAKLAHADPSVLRDSVLRNVPITEKALALKDPLGWVLPFRHLDLCMRNNTLLQFVNQLPAGAMVLEKPFEAEVVSAFQVAGQPSPEVVPFLGGVFSQPKPSDAIDQLRNSINQGTARVKEVFVVSYRLDPNACRHRAPGPVGGGVP